MRARLVGCVAGAALAVALAVIGFLLWPSSVAFNGNPLQAFDTVHPRYDARLLYGYGLPGIPVGALVGFLFGSAISRAARKRAVILAVLAALVAVPIGGAVLGLLSGWNETSYIPMTPVGAAFIFAFGSLFPLPYGISSLAITLVCALTATAALRRITRVAAELPSN